MRSRTVSGGVIAIVVSTVGLWAWLPGGEASNSMPKLGYMLVWSGAWALVSSALVALRAPMDWRRWRAWNPSLSSFHSATPI